MKLIALGISGLLLLVGTVGFASEEVELETEKEVVAEEVETLELEEKRYTQLDYRVYQGNTHLDSWVFESKEEAIREALKWNNSYIIWGENIVWRYEDRGYRVYQGRLSLENWVFDSKEQALQEALKWSNSHIMHNGERIWSYEDRGYKVYQGNIHISGWTFSTEQEAIKEALKWNNSHIMHNGERIWNYEDQLYKVYQGSTHLKNWVFRSRDEAIKEAVRWSNSHIVHKGVIIWREIDSRDEEKPVYIAHGGGEVEGIKLSNSREAIVNSLSKGIDHIELDFTRTSDNEYILLHNWGKIKEWTGKDASVMSKEEFKNLSMKHGLTMLDLDELSEIMREYPQLRVVTDTKYGNKELLKTIKQSYPELFHRFIPQIYEESEYSLARDLGFGDIVYSLYQVWSSDSQVIEFAKTNNLFAVTMAPSRTTSGLPLQLSRLGIMTYCHTINTLEEVDLYVERGVGGFYTDSLY